MQLVSSGLEMARAPWNFTSSPDRILVEGGLKHTPPSQKALRYARTTFSIWVPSGEHRRQLIVCAFIQHALRGKGQEQHPLASETGRGGFMVPTKNC